MGIVLRVLKAKAPSPLTCVQDSYKCAVPTFFLHILKHWLVCFMSVSDCGKQLIIIMHVLYILMNDDIIIASVKKNSPNMDLA